MNFKKKSLLLAGLIFSNVHAYEVEGLKVSGEAAFDYNLVSTGDEAIPAAGGGKDNQYRFNYAQLLLKKDVEKLSFFSRLFYLPTTYDTNGNQNTANLGVLYQLEVFYKLAPKLDIGFGRFLTTMGYESPFRTNNLTYNYTISRQTLYPGYADGLRARYFAHKYLTANLSSYNRFANSSFGDDNSTSKATEISLTGTIQDFTWFAGYITSRDTNATEKVDNTGASVWFSYKFWENFNFVATFENRTSDTKDSALLYTQSISGTLAYTMGIHNFAARYEHVTGADNINAINGAADFKTANRVNSITLTDKIAIDKNLNLYLEYRGNHADDKAFVKDTGSTVSDASMFTIGAIAHF